MQFDATSMCAICCSTILNFAHVAVTYEKWSDKRADVDFTCCFDLNRLVTQLSTWLKHELILILERQRKWFSRKTAKK